MKEIYLTFTEQIPRTSQVTSFRFASPEALDFIPGQFAQIIFDPQNRGNREINKFLSFSCAPGKGFIEFTKKWTGSAFSRRLKDLQPGQHILLKGPLGNCVFREEYQQILFLIGGIGITPVISILEHIMTKKLPTDVCLLYSNQAEAEIAFKKELDAWAAENQNLKVFNTVVASAAKDPGIGFGMIDGNMVRSKAPDYLDRHIFIFGPPGMVQAMQVICCELGCRKEMTVIENFTGYE